MKECINLTDNSKAYYCYFSGDNCGIQDINIFFKKVSSTTHLNFEIKTKYTKSSLVNLNIKYNEIQYKFPFNSFIVFNLSDKKLYSITKEDFETKYQLK